MWKVVGDKSPEFVIVKPVEVLYEFDGPRIFTCRDHAGASYLAYQCGEEKNLMRFLIVPFDDGAERRLTNGEDSLRDALMSERAWIFDVDFKWNIVGSWCISVDDLPEKCIPRPGVMLWSHLRPRIKQYVNRRGSTSQMATTIYMVGGKMVTRLGAI